MQTEARHSPSPLSLWCAFSATQQPAAAGCEGPAEPKVGVISSCRAVSGEPHPHHGTVHRGDCPFKLRCSSSNWLQRRNFDVLGRAIDTKDTRAGPTSHLSRQIGFDRSKASVISQARRIVVWQV